MPYKNPIIKRQYAKELKRRLREKNRLNPPVILEEQPRFCSKCHKGKKNADFSKNIGNKGGLQYSCKDCLNRKCRERYICNLNKEHARSKRYRNNNSKRMYEKLKIYRKENPEKTKAFKRNWRKKYPEKAKIKDRRDNQRRYSTPKGKLRIRMSTYIYRFLKNNKGGRHWENLVGYSVEELKQHLESKFQEGMSWDNYGEWHIDHKIPVAVFNFDHPEDIDFKRCWALENLQPMWAKENIAKHAKIDKHFQPMLKLRIG